MTSIFWHRRDLRLHDNAGLFKALKSGDKIQPIFIFDSTILSRLRVSDQRVLFIHQEIKKLKEKYAEYGSDLKVYHGNPLELIPLIADKLTVNPVTSSAKPIVSALRAELKTSMSAASLSSAFPDLPANNSIFISLSKWL